METKKRKPIIEIDEIVTRVMVKFLYNIDVRGQISISKGEVRKGKLYEYWGADEKNVLLVDFDELGTVKIPNDYTRKCVEIIQQGWDETLVYIPKKERGEDIEF